MNRRPVLIMGWIPRIVLPIARSLRRHGIAVDLVSFLPYRRIRSTAIREFRSIPRPDLDGGGFVEQLRRFIVERGHDMLVPTDDWMLTAVVEHYDSLADLLRVACPPPAITRQVLQKTETLRIAAECGIQVPKTLVVWSSSELHDQLGLLPFPWVVKPAWRETRPEKLKSCVLAATDEVIRRFPAGLNFSPPMLVQEHCSGVGVGLEALMHRGQSIALFQHRRLKEMPYTGGISVTAVADPLNENLIKHSLALLRALQWEGVAMVEFKISAEGRVVLMEVNGRYWGTIGLPISAGVDFPWYHWQVVHDEAPEVPTSYRMGAKWRSTVDYIWRLHTLVDLAQAGSSRARDVLWNDLRQLPWDFGWSVRDATFRAFDPFPFVREMSRATKHIFVDASVRISRALMRRLQFLHWNERWKKHQSAHDTNP